MCRIIIYSILAVIGDHKHSSLVVLEINRIDNELLFRRHGNLIYCSAI